MHFKNQRTDLAGEGDISVVKAFTGPSKGSFVPSTVAKPFT
jgi:hypothetical protein